MDGEPSAPPAVKILRDSGQQGVLRSVRGGNAETGWDRLGGEDPPVRPSGRQVAFSGGG